MAYKQDMPPSGGYAPITYKRVPLKQGLNAKFKLFLTACVTGAGWVVHNYGKKKITNDRIEMKCGTLALYPMLLAECDRMLLKQLKKNRDAEEELMKDVQGWEVGKWKQLAVFNSLDPDEYFKPSIHEYFAHTDKHVAKYIFNLPKLL